ncbi:C6 zinc finger domain protein [Metarhizium album ARSEF 1941]|uniref:C6 zinc finger domain protein n=1 Tax=Metarhizium album (strain ARSEF 1941) TaxID=1081103 RepID=A0A0B2WL49_METAS|nr:C6 zinc finger domain protein [Metarhizium album ARSEF 1941]KHN94419.1 C6 zinc finger domain protein [Metarhizium album ARSEF 1941]
MKIRQRTICHTCRARKLGCDGRSPSCSQCLKSSLACGGYHYDLIFAEPLTPGPRAAGGRRRAALPKDAAVAAAKPGLPPPGIRQPLSWPLNDILSVVVQNFIPIRDEAGVDSKALTAPSRVCGSWIEVVPDLKTSGPNGHALTSSIKAFAFAITCCTRRVGASVVDALAAHGTALSSLHHALIRGRNEGPDELSAAIMFLFLSEILMSANTSPGIHIGGLSRLMLSRGPAYYAHGTPHRIFIGCRPSLVIHCICDRRACFLEAPEWCTIPFHASPAEPLQELISIGACIPSLLQAMDMDVDAPACLDKLLDTMRRLDGWRRSYSAKLGAAYGADVAASAATTADDIWYPDITVANSLTHYWAFWIICATYAVQLQPRPASREAIRSKAVLIMKSVAYLTREDMKLFGATSLGLPLRVAYEYFEQQVGDTESAALSDRVMSNIHDKGYSYLRVFIESDAKILRPLSAARRERASQRGTVVGRPTAPRLAV